MSTISNKAEDKTTAESTKAQPNTIDLVIDRIYIKDLSFEAPNTPVIFKQNWEPKLQMELNINHNKLSEKAQHEVVLHITIHVKLVEQDAFLVEVKQAGIFTIHNQEIKPEALSYLLNATCPSILFPYARTIIATLISNGSFPQLNLNHLNFDNLYLQKLTEQQTASVQ